MTPAFLRAWRLLSTLTPPGTPTPSPKSSATRATTTRLGWGPSVGSNEFTCPVCGSPLFTPRQRLACPDRGCTYHEGCCEGAPCGDPLDSALKSPPADHDAVCPDETDEGK